MSCEEKLQKLGLFNLVKRWLGWGLTAAPDTYGEGTQKLEAGSSQQCVVGDELWQKLKEERFRQEIRRPFPPGGQGWAGVWVAQGGCAGSIPGGFRALPAHGPEQPGLPEREAVLDTS